MAITEGNQMNFEQSIQKDWVLVDFFATWCGPCRMLSPILEELASERSEINIVKMDIDQNEDIARQFGIMSVPTLVLFHGGQQVAMKTGFMPKEMLMNWLEENRS